MWRPFVWLVLKERDGEYRWAGAPSSGRKRQKQSGIRDGHGDGYRVGDGYGARASAWIWTGPWRDVQEHACKVWGGQGLPSLSMEELLWTSSWTSAAAATGPLLPTSHAGVLLPAGSHLGPHGLPDQQRLPGDHLCGHSARLHAGEEAAGRGGGLPQYVLQHGRLWRPAPGLWRKTSHWHDAAFMYRKHSLCTWTAKCQIEHENKPMTVSSERSATYSRSADAE